MYIIHFFQSNVVNYFIFTYILFFVLQFFCNIFQSHCCRSVFFSQMNLDSISINMKHNKVAELWLLLEQGAAADLGVSDCDDVSYVHIFALIKPQCEPNTIKPAELFVSVCLCLRRRSKTDGGGGRRRGGGGRQEVIQTKRGWDQRQQTAAVMKQQHHNKPA